MTKLQKEMILGFIKGFLVIIGIILMIYLMATFDIFAMIVVYLLVITILTVIVTWVMFTCIREIIKDYKLRGILDREEYDLYNEYLDPKSYVFMDKNDEKRIDAIKEKIESSKKYKIRSK